MTRLSSSNAVTPHDSSESIYRLDEVRTALFGPPSDDYEWGMWMIDRLMDAHPAPASIKGKVLSALANLIVEYEKKHSNKEL